MADSERPTYFLQLDAPLIVEYDATNGMVGVAAPGGLSTGGQMNVGVQLTPEAAIELLGILQNLEKDQDTPPSAHTKQRSQQ